MTIISNERKEKRKSKNKTKIKQIKQCNTNIHYYYNHCILLWYMLLGLVWNLIICTIPFIILINYHSKMSWKEGDKPLF